MRWSSIACAALSLLAPGCEGCQDHERPALVEDAATSSDAPVLVDACAASCEIAAPRPIAPLSTSTVTSQRPTLRWALAPGTDGARVEICRDRACTLPVTSMEATGASAAPTSDLPPGVLFWRLHGRAGAMTSAAPSATWQFTVGARSAPVDTSWGTTLDVNGDGYGDVAVGAFGASSGVGHAHLYFGGPSGIAETPSLTLEGPDGGTFGDSVVSAGDVDGDGYGDLVVGAPRVASLTGRAYVYLGGPSGPDAAPAITLRGPDGTGTFFGRALTSAGDVNGDGYGDLAVGAHMFSDETGRIHLYLGSASGLSSTPALTLTGGDGARALYGLAASTGDLNGDGYGDLAVGAFGARAGVGRTYVYLGSASGLLTDAPTTLTGPGGSEGNFGYSVACAADVNGDGYADLAVGAPGVTSSTGAAYVFLGGPSGVSTSPATTLPGLAGASGLFGFPVARAGDLDGDGYGDLAIGAYQTASNTGVVHVFLGSASGLATTASPMITGPDGPAGYFAGSVAGAGDVDGDGYADLVVGAFGVSSNTGRAFVYLGGAAGLSTIPATSLTSPDGIDSDFGYWVARADATSDAGVPWCSVSG